jgi:sugar phosphate isomerase/epimerase
MEWAEELGARTVVLHLGEVELGETDDPGNLYNRVQHSVIGEHEKRILIERHLAMRKKRAPRHLDAVFFSLDRLDRIAEKRGIRLGIENRYFYHQIPNSEEVGEILNRFSSTGYWHDFGHGNAQEYLGIVPHLEPLQSYRTRLLGVHIHDAAGLDDHRGIGEGEICYDGVAALLSPDTLRILELRPETTLANMQESIEYVRKHL